MLISVYYSDLTNDIITVNIDMDSKFDDLFCLTVDMSVDIVSNLIFDQELKNIINHYNYELIGYYHE